VGDSRAPCYRPHNRRVMTVIGSGREYLANRWRVIFLSAVILLGLCYWYTHRPDEPTRVFHQFVNALKKRDVETLYRLSHPVEREQLHLTPEGLRVALDTLLARKQGDFEVQDASGAVEREKHGCWIVSWRQDQNNPFDRATGNVSVTRVGQGWYVHVTPFIAEAYRNAQGGAAAYDKPQTLQLLHSLFRKADMRGVLNLDGSIKRYW